MRCSALVGIGLTALLYGAALPRIAADLSIPDVDGHVQHPLRAEGAARILFFIATDCPIANSYAPEVQRMCAAYKSRGVSCELIYVDPQLDPAALTKHRAEFGYEGLTAILDSTDRIADAAGATVTPEAVVINHDGQVLYRGRIDNRWAGLGKARRQTTVLDLRNALEEILARKTVTVSETKPVGCYIERAGILSK